MNTILKSSLAAAMFASTAAATPAIAGALDEVTVATVRYSDLDLSTQSGQRQLHARLRNAAQYVCGMDIRTPGSLIPSREARACYSENLRNLERRIATLVEAERRNV
ncbi:MAG: UrcA family protein [Alteraurantiacibacter sp. bin_em_oilr2.035]|nr:UrcA family protein [Alteraurantiacibacter sp. bin_em_oilr2.035]